MANQRKINTISILRGQSLGHGSAGTTHYSDSIDLRDIAQEGIFSVSYRATSAGGISTCASCKLSFLGCAVYDGTYYSPTDGTFGTLGNQGGQDIVTITPPVFPFMKICMACGTSGTVRFDHLDLHVR